MTVAAVIERLETIPALTGKISVGIPAQMESLSNAPYAWLTNIIESADPSDIYGPTRQRVTQRIEITVGARDFATISSTRDAIIGALLGYKPVADAQAIEYRGGRMESGDPGWWLWRDEFMTVYYWDTR